MGSFSPRDRRGRKRALIIEIAYTRVPQKYSTCSFSSSNLVYRYIIIANRSEGRECDGPAKRTKKKKSKYRRNRYRFHRLYTHNVFFFFPPPPTSIFRPRCRHGIHCIYTSAQKKGEKKLDNNGCRAAGREDETIGKSSRAVFLKKSRRLVVIFCLHCIRDNSP